MTKVRRQMAAADKLAVRLDDLVEEARKAGFEVKVVHGIQMAQRIELVSQLDNASEGYNIETNTTGLLQSVRELTIWVPADQRLTDVDESKWRYVSRKRSLRQVEERVGVCK